MRIKQKRNLMRPVEFYRFGNNPVDLHAVLAALPANDFARPQRVFGQPRVLIRDAFQRTKAQVAAEHFIRMRWVAQRSHRRLPICADACKIDHRRGVRQRPDRSRRHVSSKNSQRFVVVRTEIDLLAISRPRGLAGVQLKRSAQFLWRPSTCVHNKKILLVNQQPGAAQIGNPLAVRGPSCCVRRVRRLHQLSLCAARHVQHPCRLQGAVVQPRRGICRERDVRAVGRPARVAYREISLADLLFLARRDVPRPELRHLEIVIDHDGIVLLFGALLILFIHRRRRREQKRLTIGRNLKSAHTGLVLRYLPGLSAIRIHEPHLWLGLLLFTSVHRERQYSSVRRPFHIRDAFFTSRELPRRARRSRGRNDP